MTTTIYDSLKETHEELKELMTKMSSSKSSPKERHVAFEDFAVVLEAHASAEERYFYDPVHMEDENLSKTRHANMEHGEAEELVDKAKKLDPKGDAFKDKLKEISKEVRHHIDEEEHSYFQLSGKTLSKAQETELAKKYDADYERLRSKLAKK